LINIMSPWLQITPKVSESTAVSHEGTLTQRRLQKYCILLSLSEACCRHWMMENTKASKC
jgi:hypothetical protein